MTLLSGMFVSEGTCVSNEVCKGLLSGIFVSYEEFAPIMSAAHVFDLVCCIKPTLVNIESSHAVVPHCLPMSVLRESFEHTFRQVHQSNESLLAPFEEFGNNSYTPNFLGESSIEQDPQKYFPTASWQYQISNEFELATRAFSDWYRLYLPDPQQSERNLEWTPPDEFYHGNLFADKLTESITWNQISEIQIDYEKHSLVLQSFNKAITLLDQHREILDRLAYELLASGILREPEVQKILKEFNLNLDDSTPKDQFDWDRNYKNFLQQATILSKNWGESSRRLESRWINGKLITDAK